MSTKGGKSKSGAANTAAASGAPKTVQTRSAKAGLQVCLLTSLIDEYISDLDVLSVVYSSLWVVYTVISNNAHNTTYASEPKPLSIHLLS